MLFKPSQCSTCYINPAKRHTMPTLNFYRRLAIDEDRHHAADARYLDKLDAALDAADVLIGKLCREGREVAYLNQRNAAGRMTGRIIEGTSAELLAFIVRNPRYIAFA